MMNERQMTGAQALALARLVCTIRPEWDEAGVIANLGKLAEPLATATPRALAAAMNPAAKTPAAITWTPAPAATEAHDGPPQTFCAHCGRGADQCWRAQVNTGLDPHPYRPAGQVRDPLAVQHLGTQPALIETETDTETDTKPDD